MIINLTEIFRKFPISVTHDTRPSDPAMPQVTKFKVLIHSWHQRCWAPSARSCLASTPGPTSPSTPRATSASGRGTSPTSPAGCTRSVGEIVWLTFYNRFKDSHVTLARWRITPCPGSGTGTRPSSPLTATRSSTTRGSPWSRPGCGATTCSPSGDSAVNKQRQKINLYSD